MPSAWLALPISPQAKTLLMTFCDAADGQGVSYYSYEQLGEMLQRSKASVCAYVKELREQGLITSTQQTYGNGYNYRLLIRIIGWADILAHWAKMAMEGRARQAVGGRDIPTPTYRKEGWAFPDRKALGGTATSQAAIRWAQGALRKTAGAVQDPERRIEPAERKDPSGPRNQIHQTKTPAAAPRVEWTESDEEAWRRFRPSDRDPPFQTHGTPSPALLRKVIDAAEALKQGASLLSSEDAKSVTREGIDGFVALHRLEASLQEREEAVEALAGPAATVSSIHAALEALECAWKPHWRYLSSPKQIIDTVSAAREAAMPSKAEIERIGRFAQRAWIASTWLAKHPPSSQLSLVPDS